MVLQRRGWIALLLLLALVAPLQAAEDLKSSGSLAAAEAKVRLNMPAVGAVAFQVTGTFSATITFEVSVDGSNFVAVPATNVATGAKSSTTTTTGIYIVHAPGARYIQARVSSYTSGTAVVTGNATLATLQSSAFGTSASGVSDTELPAAVSLGADIATPTAPFTGAASYGFDGSNWDPTNTFPGSTDTRSASTITGLNTQAFGYAFNDTGNVWQRLRTEDSPYPTGTHRVVAGGYTKIVTATLTRPANTTAYASGDEVTDTGGTIRTFTSAARASGLSGVITGADLIFSTVWSTLPSGLELHIYDTTSTPTTDNSAFAPSDGEAATELGVITFSSTSTGTVNFTMDSGQVNIPYVTVGSANLYGRLVARNAAQAGANSDTITIRLRVLPD